MKTTLFPVTVLVLCLTSSWAMLSAASQTAVDDAYKVVTDIPYRVADDTPHRSYIEERCRLDLYYPTGETGFPTLVWFHGGGLSAGSKFVPKQLKEQGLAVVAANYRLHPKAECPIWIEDAAAAVAWTFEHIHGYGGDPQRIYVSGHSAGGYLTSMVGLDKRYLARHGIDADDIAGLIPFSGHTITHFTVRKERDIPRTRPIIDEFAPLYHVRKDAPPLVLITGDRDLELLGRYEENAYLKRMMDVVGHPATELYEVQGFNHGQMAAPAHAILLRHIKKGV